MDKLKNLQVVAHALEQIEVKGSENMSMLLNCIKIIDATINQMTQEKAAAQDVPEVTADGAGN